MIVALSRTKKFDAPVTSANFPCTGELQSFLHTLATIGAQLPEKLTTTRVDRSSISAFTAGDINAEVSKGRCVRGQPRQYRRRIRRCRDAELQRYPDGRGDLRRESQLRQSLRYVSGC